MKYFVLLCTATIVYGIYLFTFHLLQRDILFHTDIARDFLLMQDIAVNHKLTLIGPRAGGIPGTFFGPLWLYLNIPAFIIGNGNPLVIGYFWLFVVLFGLGTTFYISRKIFSTEVAIFSTAIFVYTIIFLAPGFTQSFAPIIISPILLWTVYLFIEKKKIRYLSFAALLSGLLLQFQPAFGSIILFITFILSLIILIRRKQLTYQLVWFLAFVPLLTYVAFELRHNFLETHALYTFIFHHSSQSFQQVTYPEVAHNRLEGFLDSVNLININTIAVNSFFVLLNIYIFYLWFTTRESGMRTFVLLVYIYLLCFWLITFLFKGTVWNYYYWGFYPLLSITLGSLYLKIDRRVFIIVFSVLLFFMVRNGYNTVVIWQSTIYAKDTSSWIVNQEIADYIYRDARQDFGFYIYSTDLFGYAKRYAINYVGSTGQYSEKGYVCQKRPITYLIYNKTTQGSHTDPIFWKNIEVNIKMKPVAKKVIQGIVIEKYILPTKELHEPSDPTMICGLEWR